ncbi:ABC transporter ATP-binding protein [Acidisphaera sp. L21]|uniref:ABC transporter ATP-binding protein n=1 Tax=Acidisphaera sp. L21 TaxID=1641851 RepID=UPI00131EA95D|nr:ABC transporter ATP-binding protein [Acidisphaera sp. L21]
MSSLLDVRDLSVAFDTAAGRFNAVQSVDLTVASGEVLCVVGESGSGKSVSVLAVMGLLPPTGRVTSQEIRFRGEDLRTATPRARRRLIGRDVAMVFQEPTSSLNPCYTIGWQIGEALRVHGATAPSQVRRRVLDLLGQVGVPAPEQRMRSFPHQLSGGLNQRVMIAMAIACDPALLIADEPTTALDVTVQQGVLDLLVGLQRDRGMGLVLITHDMGVVAQTAQRVQVMYAGQVMEEQPADPLFAHPRHPYTAALLDALPERAEGKLRLPTIPGMVPGIDDRPGGCLFAPRCRFTTPKCTADRPALRPVNGAKVRCHYPLDDAGQPTGWTLGGST